MERKYVTDQRYEPQVNVLNSEDSQSGHSGSEKVDTYFVYDDSGNLVLVISPESADGKSGDLNFCYEYDLLNRAIQSDFPGAGPSTMGYYDNDLLKWETDAKGNTINYIYDEYGRLSQKYLGGSFQGDNLNGGILIMDDQFYQSNSGSGFKSQLKNSKIAKIEGENNITSLLETDYQEYDEFARLVRSISTNNVGGSDTYELNYRDHADNIGSTTRTHTGFENLTISESFQYDHSLRPTNHFYSTNLTPGNKLIASNAYTYRDELKSKNIGGAQTLDYLYNSRSWLTNINSLGSSHPLSLIHI